MESSTNVYDPADVTALLVAVLCLYWPLMTILMIVVFSILA